MRDPLIKYRLAIPADVERIGRLYRQEYGTGERAACSRYPFPQFFDPDWLIEAVRDPSFHWVIAASEQRVLASVGVVLNIGGPRDQVAESFGLVVDATARRQGIAGKLFRHLLNSIGPAVQFIIGETRTANSGGWRVLRRCDFVPIGFEPFAHITPVGAESMLLMGLIPEMARRSTARVPREFRTTAKVHNLATEVLAACRCSFGETIDWTLAETSAIASQAPTDASPIVLSNASSATAAPRSRLQVVRDDEHGKRLLASWSATRRDLSSVVGLERLVGTDRNRERFEKRYYVGHLDEEPVCCMCVSWDGLDQRARILDSRTLETGFQAELVAGFVDHVQRERSGQITIVVDVRGDGIGLQLALERLGFQPTAYYPCLISQENHRLDCIQYTHSVDRAFQEGWSHVDRLEWEPASRIASAVAGARP